MYLNPMFFKKSTPSVRCCVFISLRLGCGLICFIWAAFSMYLAVLSFQDSSLFYSYMPSAPITIYGVCNLILSLVSLGGIAVIIYNIGRYVKALSNAVFVSVFIVLSDSFINIILFITNKSDFKNWCVTNASNEIRNNASIEETSFNTTEDLYNCQNLWEEELKFGIIFYILMFAFYVYWSLCIYSHSIVREFASINEWDQHRSNNIPIPPPMAPQNTMDPNLPFQPPERNFNDDHSVIILNNNKPASKSAKKRIDNFSFQHFKESTRPQYHKLTSNGPLDSTIQTQEESSSPSTFIRFNQTPTYY